MFANLPNSSGRLRRLAARLAGVRRVVQADADDLRVRAAEPVAPQSRARSALLISLLGRWGVDEAVGEERAEALDRRAHALGERRRREAGDELGERAGVGLLGERQRGRRRSRSAGAPGTASAIASITSAIAHARGRAGCAPSAPLAPESARGDERARDVARELQLGSRRRTGSCRARPRRPRASRSSAPRSGPGRGRRRRRCAGAGPMLGTPFSREVDRRRSTRSRA